MEIAMIVAKNHYLPVIILSSRVRGGIVTLMLLPGSCQVSIQNWGQTYDAVT